MAEMSDSGLSLNRWARLKQQRAVIDEQLPQPENLASSDSVAIKLNHDSDQQIATNLESCSDFSAEEYCAQLPAIETLSAASDFSAFMDDRVFPELRRHALRMLFKQPQFNIRDGLDDYDDDYTFFEKLGNIETCDMKFAKAQEEIKMAANEHIAKSDAETPDDEEPSQKNELESEPSVADTADAPPEQETQAINASSTEEDIITNA